MNDISYRIQTTFGFFRTGSGGGFYNERSDYGRDNSFLRTPLASQGLPLPQRAVVFLLKLRSPDWLWDPPSFLFKATGVISRRRAAEV
jgi:hypothetical protein